MLEAMTLHSRDVYLYSVNCNNKYFALEKRDGKSTNIATFRLDMKSCIHVGTQIWKGQNGPVDRYY